MIFRRLLRALGLAQLVLGALVAALLWSDSSPGRIGDNVQIALPLVAWGCAIKQKSGKDYALGFFSMLGLVHATKAGLGEAEMNQRPNGGDKGFPSGHTAAAAYGTSALLHECLDRNPAIRAVVIIAAAFVGASRIEVGAHDIWQVLAGAILGWASERLLRRLPWTGLGLWLRRALPWRELWRLWVIGPATSLGASLKGRAVLRRNGLGAAGLAVLASILLNSPAVAEIELSVYGGNQTAADGSLIDSAGSRPVLWAGRSLEMPPYWGVRLVWWTSRGLGFGPEINHAKVYADNRAELGYERLEFTDGLNIVTFNLWKRWDGRGRLTPYAGVGLGLSIPHVDVQPSGEAHTFGYQVTGPAAQMVAGLSWRLNDRWSLFGEWKATWSDNKAQLDSGGTLEAKVRTQAINLGFGLRF